jgi:SAM-dependent methyltransferase
MPEEPYWESLIDVPLTLDRLQIDSQLGDVVELGCGYGTFTIPVARRISGTLTALEIDPAMIERARQRAVSASVRNLRLVQADVLASGFGCAACSQDACLLFNILHGEEPVRVLTEAARVVRPGGGVLVTHWRYDPATPRGPTLAIRPRPEHIREWAARTGVLATVGPVIDLRPWHYGLRFKRTSSPRNLIC